MSNIVQVWTSSVAGPLDWLNATEQQRLSRFRSTAAATDFLVGTTLARFALGAWLGVPEAAVPLDRTCERCGAAHGRPTVVGTHVSIAHAAGTALVAVGDSPVGVDLEPSGREVPANCGATSLTDWVRKEAALKLTGDGLRVPMDQIGIDQGIVVQWPTCPAPSMRIDDLGLAGFTGAVAMHPEAELGPVTVVSVEGVVRH